MTSSYSNRTYNKKDNTNIKDQKSFKQYNNITNNDINYNKNNPEKNTDKINNFKPNNIKSDDNTINEKKNNNVNKYKYKSSNISNNIDNNKNNVNNDDKNINNKYNDNNNDKKNIKNTNNIEINKPNDTSNNKDSKNNIENNIINNIITGWEKDNFDNKNNNNNYKEGIININNKDNININNKYNISNNESCLINNIKSAYILENIFNYINDEEFLYKLINYSKLIQKKLKITFYTYKNKYLVKEKILLEDNPTKDDFVKIISKDTIYIDNLDDKDNKKKYIDYFRKTKSNYLSLYYKFINFNCINSLKELNLDFSKIKKMTLIKEKAYWGDDEGKIENLLQSLFSITNNLENNLIYLKIFLNCNGSYDVVPNHLFEKINNFKSLRYLYLKKVNFSEPPTIKIKNLEIFYCDLCNNIKIKDCEKLKKLIYNSNNLSNLYNLLGDANSTKLEVLDLFNNKISDIKILEKIKFDNLKILDLSMNYISDINCLENDNFKNLIILNLHNNDIKDINILEKVKFEKLEELYLGRNNISNIDVLAKVNFKDLKVLNLSWNNISRINALEKVKFEKLEILNLSENKIKDNFTKSKELLLSVAAISDSKLLDLKGTEFSEYKIKIKRNIS